MSLISEHGTKLYGSATAILGALSTLITTGAFNGLLSDSGVRWIGIVAALATAAIGGMTAARGFNNTTQERVAAAMETAIKAQPSGDAHA